MSANVSPLRYRAAAAASAFTGVGLAGVAASNGIHDWPMVVLGLFVAGLGVLSFVRRTVETLVFARGAALAVLIPKLYVLGHNTLHGSFGPPHIVVLAISAGAALVASRPMLTRGRAATGFVPVGYRGWLLAAATGCSATGFLTSHLVLGALNRGALSDAALFAAFAMAQLAAGIALLRMRAWGLLLGAFSCLVIVAHALAVNAYPIELALASVSAALLIMPVLLARYDERSAKGCVRVQVEALDSAPVPRHVVGVFEVVEEPRTAAEECARTLAPPQHGR